MSAGTEPRPDPGVRAATGPTAEHDATVASLLRVARTVVRSEDLAWDVVQETLLRAWHEGRGLSCAVLCRRAVHAALHARRGALRRAFHETRCARGEETNDDPARRLDQAELAERVRAGLASLRPHQRRVLELYLAHGSYGPVARALDVPIGTVRSRLARSRRALLEAIQGPRQAFLDEEWNRQPSSGTDSPKTP